MKAIQFNPFLESLSGAFGEVVFRRVGTRTFLMHRPDLRGVRRTPAQLASQERFRRATLYAQSALGDPLVGELYRRAVTQPGQRASAIAVRDFMLAPQVDRLDLSAYTGCPGDPITVRAHDDFAVTSVSVQLADEAGSQYEAGPACLCPDGDWVYLACTAIPPGTFVRVNAVAADHPGNRGGQTLDITLAGLRGVRGPAPAQNGGR